MLPEAGRTPSVRWRRCMRAGCATCSAGTEVYETIDLPLVPVLLRMETAGVRIDRGVLAAHGGAADCGNARVSEQIFEQAGQRFNINSPKQLGDVLFNKMHLPKPMKYGKGKVVSTAQDVLEELAEHNEFRAWCWNTGSWRS